MTSKTYKDQQGNKYRKGTGGWEILRPGIGWQAFESTAYVTVISDGGAMKTIEPTPQTEPPEVAEEKQVRKVREDELFVHIAVEQMKVITATPEGFEMQPGALAGAACEDAQAMIDELKKRGRL